MVVKNTWHDIKFTILTIYKYIQIVVQQIARTLTSCIITWNIIFTLSLKNTKTRTSECFAFHHQPLSPHAVTVLRFCAILFLCGGQPPGQLPGIPPNSLCVNLSPSVTCSKQQGMPDVLGCCFWDQTTKALWYHSFALSSSLPQIPHSGEAQCPVKMPTWQGIDVSGQRPPRTWILLTAICHANELGVDLPTTAYSHVLTRVWKQMTVCFGPSSFETAAAQTNTLISFVRETVSEIPN